MRGRRSTSRLRLPFALVICLVAVVLSACESEDKPAASGSESFTELRNAAEGQTVRWWMYGGDARINRYVDDYVAPAAEKLGIELERVPVTDTAEAVQRVVAQRRAGGDAGDGARST